MVYVQDINGKPMMPTTRHGKVRRLLKDKKAVVVNLCPFTIKLMYVTSDYKQEIVSGFNFLHNPNNGRMQSGYIIIDGIGLFKQIIHER